MFSLEPSDSAHLEELYVYNVTLLEDLGRSRSAYSAHGFTWNPHVTIDPVPAEYATVEAFLGLVTAPDADARVSSQDPLRQESFDIEVAGGKEAEVTLVVTAQSGTQRVYTLAVTLHDAENCYEQRVCQEFQASSQEEACGKHCADAGAEVAVRGLFSFVN